jgi:4-amino-4-deoxy-L-arabinose transferase-like glycosyltransferase
MVRPMPTDRNRYGFWVGLAIVLALSLLARLAVLNDFPLTTDEGFHVLWVRLAQAGYRFYSEIFVSYPPLYPLSLLAAWRIWPEQSSLRLVTILCSLAGVLAVALVARRLAGDVAGLLAAVALSVAPRFLLESGGILGEIPSVALAALSIALAWRYCSGGGRAYLALSALVQSAALLCKMLPVLLTPLILLVVLSRWAEGLNWTSRTSWQPALRGALKDLALWTAAFLLPVIPFLLIYDVGAMYDQVFAFRFSARQAYEVRQFEQLLVRAEAFAGENLPLLPLALYGSLELIRRREWRSWPILGWLLLGCATLVAQTPVRTKHFVMVLFPVAVLAGVGMGWAVALRERSYRLPVPARVLTLLLVGFYLAMLPGSLAAMRDEYMTGQEPPPEYQAALEVVRSATDPGDCIVSDDSRVAVWSGRLTPPELAEISNVRLESGYLTAQQLIEATEAYNCRAVVLASGRFRKYASDYVKWAEGAFPERWEGGEITLLSRKR